MQSSINSNRSKTGEDTMSNTINILITIDTDAVQKIQGSNDPNNPTGIAQ